jgi:hypothetical protein
MTFETESQHPQNRANKVPSGYDFDHSLRLDSSLLEFFSPGLISIAESPNCQIIGS